MLFRCNVLYSEAVAAHMILEKLCNIQEKVCNSSFSIIGQYAYEIKPSGK